VANLLLLHASVSSYHRQDAVVLLPPVNAKRLPFNEYLSFLLGWVVSVYSIDMDLMNGMSRLPTRVKLLAIVVGWGHGSMPIFHWPSSLSSYLTSRIHNMSTAHSSPSKHQSPQV
jgi:hypothetical protein